jgi:hypothetical protein
MVVSLTLMPSKNKNKYLAVKYKDPETNKMKTINFGTPKGSKFIDHKDEKKKSNYIKRHEEREDWETLSPG